MFNYAEELLKFAKMEQQAWIGVKAPYLMTAIDLYGSSNFRASPIHHHKYKVVWLYEKLIDDIGELEWKIVVDEAIRLLGAEGYLIVKMRVNCTPTLPFLKMFIGRRAGISADIELEFQDIETDVFTIVFKITRAHIEKYDDHSWTFAMLTAGKKTENVVAFIQSIRNNELNNKAEIIIVGPRNPEYEKYDVSYIDTKQFRDDRYAEISKKKNVIIETASGANLLIAHDRFLLDDNFFTGFERYGYDYDFATVTQYTKNGERYPGYAKLNEDMHFSGQVAVFDYHHLYDTTYINGGLIILKTHTAKQIGFNPMLMWNQMEDVELCKTYIENGIIPRVNYAATVIVLEIAKGYFRSWVNENGLPVQNSTRQVSVQTLKKYEGNVFVKKLYEKVLGREPENQKVIEHNVNRMRSGTTKEELILDFRLSDEGLAVGTGIHGLRVPTVSRPWLMAFDGEKLIEAAYLSILGRTADKEGKMSYFKRLSDGAISKEALIEEILNSEEGKQNGVNIR